MMHSTNLAINQVPFYLLTHMGQFLFKDKNYGFKMLSLGQNPYPYPLMIPQEKEPKDYFNNVAELVFTDNIASWGRLGWQLQQSYRLLNIALTSHVFLEAEHIDLGNLLRNVRLLLLAQPSLVLYIDDVVLSCKDLVIAAHGETTVKKGYLEFTDPNTEVISYFPTGAETTTEVCHYIENGRRPRLAVRDEQFDVSLIPERYDQDYPKIFSKHTNELLPNMYFYSLPDFQAKIFVRQTGCLVAMLPDKTSLKTIIEQLPGYRFHLSCCLAVVYKNGEERKDVGPGAQLVYYMVSSEAEYNIRLDFETWKTKNQQQYSDLRKKRFFLFNAAPTEETPNTAISNSEDKVKCVKS